MFFCILHCSYTRRDMRTPYWIVYNMLNIITACLPVCLSVYLSAGLSACLFVCLLACLSVCPGNYELKNSRLKIKVRHKQRCRWETKNIAGTWADSLLCEYSYIFRTMSNKLPTESPIQENPDFVFISGTPHQPRCGFSHGLVRIFL